VAEHAESPCTGVCTIDPATGLCLGCARTGPEIFGWRDASPADRRAVLARLPARWADWGREPPPRRRRAGR
jgi:predicted Fe-S protein YdhL (DUF1289 family)